MVEHPGIELQVLIKEKGLTQKAFASILGKKISEVNELLKGKRNITIQRDFLLHQTLGTPIKYWILKQIDYDYSLIDINEKTPIVEKNLDDKHNEYIEESEETGNPIDSSVDEGNSEEQIETQEIPNKKQENQIDEDFKKRVQIFKSF